MNKMNILKSKSRRRYCKMNTLVSEPLFQPANTGTIITDYPVMDMIVSTVKNNHPYRSFNYKLIRSGIRTNPNPTELVLSKFDYNDPYLVPTVVSMLKTEVYLNEKYSVVESITSYKKFVEEEYFNYVSHIVDTYFFNLNYFVTKDKDLELEEHFVLVTRNPEVFSELEQPVFMFEVIRILTNAFITPKLVHISSSEVGAISLLFKIYPTEKIGYDTVYYLTRYGSVTENEFLRRAIRSYRVTNSRRKKETSSDL